MLSIAVLLASFSLADAPDDKPSTPSKPTVVATGGGKVISITPGKQETVTTSQGTTTTTKGGTIVLQITEQFVVPAGSRPVTVLAYRMEHGKMVAHPHTVYVANAKLKTVHENLTLQMGEEVKVRLVPDSGKPADGELNQVKAGQIVKVKLVKDEATASDKPAVVGKIDILHWPKPKEPKDDPK